MSDDLSMKQTLASLVILVATSSTWAASPLDIPQVMPVTLVTATGTLHGTLEQPPGNGPFRVALFLAGSGPTDRDGNDIRLGLHTDCYKLLAEALATHGIASLRYDKRGAGEDRVLALFENKLRFEDFVADAVTWGRKLRADPHFLTLTIIGHSEGALVGLLAAREIHADGYVSLAGAGESAQNVLLTQLKSKLPPDLYRESATIIGSLVRGKTVANVPDSLDMLFRPSVQPYLISWLRYDPAKEITNLKIPALIVQGERDLQVGAEDAHLLAKADPAAKLVLLSDMNHVLKDVSASPEDNMASYGNPALPLDPALVTSITDFIHHLPLNQGVRHAKP